MPNNNYSCQLGGAFLFPANVVCQAGLDVRDGLRIGDEDEVKAGPTALPQQRPTAHGQMFKRPTPHGQMFLPLFDVNYHL